MRVQECMRSLRKWHALLLQSRISATWRTPCMPFPTQAPFSRSQSSSPRPKRSCWNCGKSLQKSHVLFCHQDCGAIQPVDPLSSYLEILLPGLLLLPDQKPTQFDLDMTELRRRYLSLQKKVHPDQFSTKSATERHFADDQSTFLNKAYNILKDPLTRAIYLLHLNQIHISEKENQESTDPELLDSVMEAWEELDEVNSENELARVKKRNDDRISTTVSKISDAFLIGDLEKAKKWTEELKYWYSLRDHILNQDLTLHSSA